MLAKCNTSLTYLHTRCFDALLVLAAMRVLAYAY